MQTSLKWDTSERSLRPQIYLWCELLFADDSALISPSAEKIAYVFAIASAKLGPKIKIKKIEVMFQPNFIMAREDEINVDDTTLNHVHKFKYIGSIIARDSHMDADLQENVKGQQGEKNSEITTMCFTVQD